MSKKIATEGLILKPAAGTGENTANIQWKPFSFFFLSGIRSQIASLTDEYHKHQLPD